MELGVPRISLILADAGPDRQATIRFEPEWRDMRRTARRAVLKDPDLEGELGEVLAILDLEPALENAFDGGSFTVRFDSTRFDPETWWDMIEDDRKHEVVSGRDSGGDAVNRLLSCRFEFEVPIVPSDRP